MALKKIKMRLIIILILLNSYLYAQTEKSLKITEDINTLLHEYSEMCDENINYYTVQYDAIKKQVTIIICKKESIISFNLDDVNILYIDEDNELNYSLCFRCIENNKCIRKQFILSKTSSELVETKITLIFPKIVQDLVNKFILLKE